MCVWNIPPSLSISWYHPSKSQCFINTRQCCTFLLKMWWTCRCRAKQPQVRSKITACVSTPAQQEALNLNQCLSIFITCNWRTKKFYEVLSQWKKSLKTACFSTGIIVSFSSWLLYTYNNVTRLPVCFRDFVWDLRCIDQFLAAREQKKKPHTQKELRHFNISTDFWCSSKSVWCWRQSKQVVQPPLPQPCPPAPPRGSHSRPDGICNPSSMSAQRAPPERLCLENL